MAKHSTDTLIQARADRVRQRVVSIMEKNPGLHASIAFNFKDGKLMDIVNIHQTEKMNQPDP